VEIAVHAGFAAEGDMEVETGQGVEGALATRERLLRKGRMKYSEPNARE